MTRSILDTDILSEINKGIDKVVLANAALYLGDHPQLTTTSASVHEVLYGLYAQGAHRRAQIFLTQFAAHEEILPLASDYRLAAEIRAALKIAGTPIGNFDPLIAACAIERRMPLITGNIRHYGYIQSLGFPLQLLNWRNP